MVFTSQFFGMLVKKVSQAVSQIVSPVTSWDISTSTLENVWNDSNSPGSFQYTQSVYFNNDGTKMFIPWAGDTTVREYNVSTAWDLSTASTSADATYSPPASQNAIDDITFNDDGTEMYMCDRNDSKVYRYDLSTGFDLTSVTGQNASSLSTSSYETNVRGVDVLEVGGSYYFYIIGRVSDKLHRFVMTNWGDTPVVTSSVSLSTIVTDGCEPDYSGVRIKPDGTKIYVSVGPRTGTKAMNILEFDMSTAYDITSGSLTYNQAFDAPSNSGSSPNNIDGWISGFFIRRSDGIKMYIADLNLHTSNSPYDIYEFTMSPQNAWDILNSRLIGDSDVNFNGGVGDYIELQFNSDGTKAYMGEYTNYNASNIHSFNLSTAYDLSTATMGSPDATYEMTGNLIRNGATGRFCFNYDGTKLYVGGRTTSSSKPIIIEITLSTAYDLTSVTSQSTLSIDSITDSNPVGPVYARDSSTGYEYLYFGSKQGNSSNFYIDSWRIGDPFNTNTTHLGSSPNMGSSASTIDPDLAANEILYVAFVEPDGSNVWSMFVDNSGPQNLGLVRISMSTPYDGSTSNITTDYLKINNPYGQDDMTFVTARSDGLELFWTNRSSSSVSINLYKMKIGVTQTELCPLMGTLVSDGTVSNLSHGTESDFKYSLDGLNCVVLELDSSTSIKIHGHTLSTAYDTTTADTGTSSSALTTSAQCINICIQDSTTFFVLDDNLNIYKITLSSAWDASTASITLHHTIPTTTGTWGNPKHIDVFNSGTLVTILFQNVVRSWNLATAWVFTTISDTNYSYQNEDILTSLDLSADISITQFDSYSFVNNGKQLILSAHARNGVYVFDTSANTYSFSEVTKSNMIDYQNRFFNSISGSNYYSFQFPRDTVTSGTYGCALYTSGTPFGVHFSA